MADKQAEIIAGETGDPAKKGGLMGMMPMIGGVIAGVAIGAAVGLFVLGPRLAPASPAPASASPKASKDPKSNPETEAEKTGEVMAVYQVDNLVLNPAGSNGTRFLLLSVALEVKDEAAVATLKGREAEMRDMILRLFGSKTAEQVADASTREPLRTEVTAALSKMFPAGTIRKVYFPQFVIQ